ncbi:WapI family immunity protein [Hydrogenophaga sp. MI9]|uniref:WapI family immunity protein n=1 Tax=Hydrogenophaga sp. MI9 TaxID=3453719 RepID=UPI003EEAC4D7
MNTVHFGSESEYVKIELPNSYLSQGWAQAKVEISVNCFQGSIACFFDAADLESFAKQLRSLYDTLNGLAVLKPLDEQLVLELAATAGGHIKLEGEAWSQARYENRLQFLLALDQSFLPGPLATLEMLAATRIRGA